MLVSHAVRLIHRDANLPTRTVCSPYCSAPDRNPDGILRVDSQLSKPHPQGSQGEETVFQGVHVQEAVVGYPPQYLGHLCLFLLQQFHFCIGQLTRLRSFPLEDQMVRPRRMAQHRLLCERRLDRLHLAPYG